MTADHVQTQRDWARIVTDAYAAETRPPLTERLVSDVRARVTLALESEGEAVERINTALDAFEADLDAAAGPRVASLDRDTGRAEMRHRSEAGQPLRAFGGQ